ncbi:hypothetical protein J4733_25495 [Klebsiella pneumoniae]|uniref:Uncharacterized protein n=1 Tax=Klebsiella pneumoniae TaxID=573 RepID=A0A939NQR1_KLEPN|nr:hypothetical protein [Klebsiella pneumoniae]
MRINLRAPDGAADPDRNGAVGRRRGALARSAPPQAVTRDAALQTQWRRIAALRISGEENPGRASTRSHFRP